VIKILAVFKTEDRGCKVEEARKFPPILMKLWDLLGIVFIKMHLHFYIKILIRTLLFCYLLENWESGLRTARLTVNE